MLELDHQIFLYLNGLHSPFTDSVWLGITDKWFWVLYFIPALFYIYKQYGKRSYVPVIFILLLFLVVDQGSNVAKEYFARPRPCREVELQGLVHFIAPRCSLYGFWSAHAANAFAQVTFFMCLGVVPTTRMRRWVYPLIVIWAVLVSVSRIMVGVHYPFDTLAGAAFGMAGGLVVYGLYRMAAKKMRMDY